jgi:hypothetical protein
MFLSNMPRMHRFFHFLVTGAMETSQSVSEWTKQETASQIRTIRRMLQHHNVQMARAFKGVGDSVQTTIMLQHCDTLRV